MFARRALPQIILCGLLLTGLAHGAASTARPNILWITSEDNSPYLGCYGDPNAETPNLDRLAAAGVRYRHAFANAPVCSTTRSTLITGMYATSLGVQHHRSRVAIPAAFKLYPTYLRAAGYYCTNNPKTDYNLKNAGQPWNESGAGAHYRKRAPGQPFFAIFNLGSSHESRVAPKAGKTAFRVPVERIVLPPYHPDTPAIRRDWANYYDQVTEMDREVGAVLAELEREGLADDTIVFYCSDHGGALPGGKRSIHDSGTRIPFIVRFPEKWRHLAPAARGAWVDRPIALVDVPPTFFSLCDVPIPAHYEGVPFLGASQRPAPGFVYLFRDRMGERHDAARAIRDSEFRYVRNYAPHRAWGQHCQYAHELQPSMRSWFAEFEAGRCNDAQSTYWRPRRPEELYQVSRDPFETRNLAEDPGQAARLGEMRAKLRAQVIRTRDTGFIPEGMFDRLAGLKTIYDYAHSDAYPIEAIVTLAEQASSYDAKFLPELRAALANGNPVIRYWGATGCLVLREKSAPARAALRQLLQDDWPDVRIVAAEALGWHGELDAALTTLATAAASSEPYVAMEAVNALDNLRPAGAPLARVQALVRGLKLEDPAIRIQEHLLSLK
jgi:arylsulfatase A-like enzyme